jgi:hypothetical protein
MEWTHLLAELAHEGHHELLLLVLGLVDHREDQRALAHVAASHQRQREVAIELHVQTRDVLQHVDREL